MTDDIQRVREAYEAAAEEAIHSCGDGPRHGPFYMSAFFAALAKRLQPRPEPVKKEWCVSDETWEKYATHAQKQWRDPSASHLNAIAPDIIRERPDLVKAEWERRVRERARWLGVCVVESMTAFDRYDLFPELDP